MEPEHDAWLTALCSVFAHTGMAVAEVSGSNSGGPSSTTYQQIRSLKRQYILDNCND